MHEFIIVGLCKSWNGMWCIRMQVYHMYYDVGMIVHMIELLVPNFTCSMYMLDYM